MEYAYAEALCLRSLVSGVPFQKSVSPKQSLNKIEPLFVQGIRFTQKPCASEALWRGCHFKNWNTGTKYRHFVFQDFFNRAGRRL